MTAITPAEGTRPAAAPGSGRTRLATALLVLPATAWYLILLVLPLALVLLFSFGERSSIGGYAGGFTLDNYATVFKNPGPFITSLTLAAAGTVLCLLVGLPLAYFIATRAGDRKSLFIVLLVIPFWTSFLIRTYAWLLIIGPEGAAGFVGDLIGNPGFRILGTEFGVLIGMVYGYLPLMVFPLYVTLERMDRLTRRGIQGPGGRPLGDLPPGHAADRPAGPDHRQHPRVHPDDGRVRHPAAARLRSGLHDRQRARPALPRGAQLAGRLGIRRGPHPGHADRDHGLRVGHQSWPAGSRRERPVRPA